MSSNTFTPEALTALIKAPSSQLNHVSGYRSTFSGNPYKNTFSFENAPTSQAGSASDPTLGFQFTVSTLDGGKTFTLAKNSVLTGPNLEIARYLVKHPQCQVGGPSGGSIASLASYAWDTGSQTDQEVMREDPSASRDLPYSWLRGKPLHAFAKQNASSSWNPEADPSLDFGFQVPHGISDPAEGTDRKKKSSA